MRGYPRPLAIGLLKSDAHAGPAARSRARVALALHANDEGYALVETFETGETLTTEDGALQALEDLAVRLDADAVIYVGDVNQERIHDVADRVRMVVIGLE